MQVSDVLARPSWLRIAQRTKISRDGKLTLWWYLDQSFVRSLNSNFQNFWSESWQYVRPFSSSHTLCRKQRNQLYSLPITDQSTLFSRQKLFHKVVDTMRLCATAQIENSIQLELILHRSWLSFQTRIQSYEEVPAQNPWRYASNTNWADKIVLKCRWCRTIFLHASRQLTPKKRRSKKKNKLGKIQHIGWRITNHLHKNWYQGI